ncbi:MAG: secondary thiamine-phosphate synthase enzyme YjbQ [Anaerolineaceae bacterium]|jgi:secondary thiamine-phosphate synthase enzyme|nr:secondary thiamine-phosphate synthase enzyme YjbQ [Anaerolineaceae bacterium]
MFQKLEIKTTKRQELIVLTDQIQQVVNDLDVKSGICVLFCPHTTAALTINSYLDPATAVDLVKEIDRLVPTRTDFVHVFDTPSDAAGHIKASLIGGQYTIIIDQGKLQIGGSQGIMFWEFDGPRNRQVFVKIIASD